MDRPAQDSAHFTTDEDRRLRRIAGREDAVAMLARRSLDADLGRLEQEAVDPEAPAIARPSDGRSLGTYILIVPLGALLLVMITLTGVHDGLVPRTRRGRRAQIEARGEVSSTGARPNRR